MIITFLLTSVWMFFFKFLEMQFPYVLKIVFNSIPIPSCEDLWSVRKGVMEVRNSFRIAQLISPIRFSFEASCGAVCLHVTMSCIWHFWGACSFVAIIAVNRFYSFFLWISFDLVNLQYFCLLLCSLKSSLLIMPQFFRSSHSTAGNHTICLDLT